MKRKWAFTLIELLVVIAIIAILASISVPTIGRAMQSARRSQAATEVRMLETAWRAYYNEYNQWPTGLMGYDTGPNIEANTTGIEAGANVVRLLRGENINDLNPRERRFMEFPERSIDDQMNFVDPWDNPYKYMLDFNYDNRVQVEFTGNMFSTNLYRNVAVWSRGPQSDHSNVDTRISTKILSWDR